MPYGTTSTTSSREGCPACGSLRSRQSSLGVQLRECSRCSCLFGTAYLGESYGIVKPYLKDGDVASSRPFDITTLGSRGVGRRHGFYDPSDGYMTQVG